MVSSTVSAGPDNFDGDDWIDGPLPTLMTALREDNRFLVEQILTSDSPNGRKGLIFGDTEIQNLIVGHVLGSPGQWNNYTASISKKALAHRKKNNGDGEISIEYLNAISEPSIPKQLGVISTAVLESSDDYQENNDTNSEASKTRSELSSIGFDSEAEVVLSSTSSFPPPPAVLGIKKLKAPKNQSKELEKINQAIISSQISELIYFVRPDPHQAKLLASAIKSFQALYTRNYSPHDSLEGDHSSSAILNHKIVYVPNQTAICNKILFEEGLFGFTNLSVEELQLDLIPLDPDVISMEIPSTIKQTFLDGVPSFSIEYIANSILRLQDVIGVIPKIVGIGTLSEQIVAKMMNLRVSEYYDGNNDHFDSNGNDVQGCIQNEYDPISSENTSSKEKKICDVEGMIVIDRRCDFITPLLSPLTYEGLIDDILGIDCGFVKVDSSLIIPEDDDDDNAAARSDSKSETSNKKDGEDSIMRNKKKKMALLALNACDTLFAEVRNQNVEKFGSFLQDQAKALKESHSNFTNKDKDLTEIHQFVKQIPIFSKNLRALTQHIHLAELVKKTTHETSFRERWHCERAMLEGESCYDTLEELICLQEPPFQLLKLLCLQSLTSGGIRGNKYDFLKREIVQTYGYEYMFVLTNLEKLGLLRRNDAITAAWGGGAGSSSFHKVRTMLNLINAEVSTLEPDDIAYVSSGYAPLSVRLIQSYITRKGWKKEDVMKELPLSGGKFIEVLQNKDVPGDFREAVEIGIPPSHQFQSTCSNKDSNNDTNTTSTSTKKPILLVFFVGGVTFMELSALRHISKSPDFPYEIVCCTTKIVNGKTLLESLI